MDYLFDYYLRVYIRKSWTEALYNSLIYVMVLIALYGGPSIVLSKMTQQND